MTSPNQATHIIHLADLHFGNGRSIAHHMATIDALKADIDVRKLTPDTTLIVIAGDVFHKKDNCGEVEIGLFQHLMDKIGKFNIIIIPGNHDLNLGKSKQGSIVRPFTIYYPNIKYSHDTESFSFMGNEFVHLSVTDPRHAESHSVRKESFDIAMVDNKIVLYHGMVDGLRFGKSSTKRNTPISHEIMEATKLTLLGDIHDPHELMQHSAYSGAYMQHVFGDDIVRGYRLWDIKARKSTYCALSTPYALIDINVTDLEPQEIEKNITNAVEYKPKAEIRLLGATKTKSSGHRNVVRVVTDANISKLQRLSNEDVLVHIKSILSNSRFTELNEESYIELAGMFGRQGDASNAGTWHVTSLWWRDLVCYGEDNYVSFDGLEGVLSGIIANNGQGKSAIADIICYALYGDSVRNTLTRRDSNDGELELGFETSNGDKYLIWRVINTTKVREHIALAHYENSRWVVVANDKTTVAREMRAIVGTYDQFMSTSLYKADKLGGIITNSSSERARLVTEILGLPTLEQLKDKKKALGDIVDAERADLPSEPDYDAIAQHDEILRLHSDQSSHAMQMKQTVQEYERTIEELTKRLAILKTAEEIAHAKQVNDQEKVKMFERLDALIPNRSTMTPIQLEEMAKTRLGEVKTTYIKTTARLRELDEIIETVNSLTMLRSEIASLETVVPHDMDKIDIAALKVQYDNIVQTMETLQTDLSNRQHPDIVNATRCRLNSIIDMDKLNEINVRLAEISTRQKNITTILARPVPEGLTMSMVNVLRAPGLVELASLRNKMPEKVPTKPNLNGFVFTHTCESCNSNIMKLGLKDELARHEQYTDYVTMIGRIKHLEQADKTLAATDTSSQDSDVKMRAELQCEMTALVDEQYKCEATKLIIEQAIKEEAQLPPVSDTLKWHSMHQHHASLGVEMSKLSLSIDKYEAARIPHANLTLLRNKLSKFDANLPDIATARNEYTKNTKTIEKLHKDEVEMIECLALFEQIKPKLKLAAELNSKDPNEHACVTSKLIDVKTRKENLDDKIDQSYRDIGILQERLNDAETAIGLKAKYDAQLPKYKYAKDMYDAFMELKRKSKLSLVLAEDYLKTVIANATHILRHAGADFTIKVYSSVGRVDIFRVNETSEVEMNDVGGFERFACSMALRMAFISSLPASANFFLVDEGFGTADKDNLPRAVEMLKAFGKQYKFALVITHIEKVQSELDVQLTIDKRNGISKITYGTPITRIVSADMPLNLRKTNDATIKSANVGKAQSDKPTNEVKKQKKTTVKATPIEKKYKCEICSAPYDSLKWFNKHVDAHKTTKK